MANFPPCPLAPGSSVWVYLRDSGGETQDLASQRNYALAYCQHYKLHLAKLFEDAATPGSSTTRRDEFELMIYEARQQNKRVDGILYWDLKRFARNQTDSMFFEADLERRGYRLISLSDDIPDTTFAPVIKAFLRWKAEQDLRDISKDSKRGLHDIVSMRDAEGNYLGLFPGKPPTCFITVPHDTGLTRNNGTPRIVQRLVPDPATWELGKLAWQMRARGISYRDIHDEVNLFNGQIGSCYAAFFRNQIYIGRLEYGNRVYENFVPSLVDLDTWQKVQAQHRQRVDAHGPISYLLTGLCECMYCKSNMTGFRNVRSDRTKFWRYYLCNLKRQNRQACESKQYSAERLEKKVINATIDYMLASSYIGKLVEQVNHHLNNTEHLSIQIERQVKEITEIEKSIANLLDLAEKSNSPALLTRLTQREIEYNQARSKLERLQREAKQQQLRIDYKTLLVVVEDIKDTLRTGEDKTRRRLLHELIEKIEVEQEGGKVHGKFTGLFDRWCLELMPPRENELWAPLFEFSLTP